MPDPTVLGQAAGMGWQGVGGSNPLAPTNFLVDWIRAAPKSVLTLHHFSFRRLRQ